jgi:hypothetical protein
MDELHPVQPVDDKRTETEQLQEAQHYIRELHLQNCLNVLVVAGLVAVVIQTFSYLFFSTPVTDLGIMLYRFSLLIGPSACFLLLLHLYELYGVIRQGEKSIPLTLDLMYFMYVGIAFITMVGVQWYYQRHSISSTFLSIGWFVVVTSLCLEVLIALLLAKYLITRSIAKHLPHFFEQHNSEKHKTIHLYPLHRNLVTPRQVYYFRKKPNVTLWEHDDCFVQLKR